MSRVVWTLNIGLGEPVHRQSSMTVGKRLTGALAWVSQNFETCYFERAKSDEEHCLIVQGHLRHSPENRRLSCAVLFGKLADAAEQDCVAVSWTSLCKPEGALFGPHADKWAPFLHALFRQPTRKVFQ